LQATRRHQWQLIALSPQVRNHSLRRERERLQLPNAVGELACRPLFPEGGDSDCWLMSRACTLTGGGQRYTTLPTLQERNAELLLHARNAGARGSMGKVRARGARGDASSVSDAKKELEIDSIAAHGKRL
jgi:hypothetical protein